MSAPLTEIVEKTSKIVSNGNFDLIVNYTKGVGLVVLATMATFYVSKMFAKRKYAIGSSEEIKNVLRTPEQYTA